MHYKQKGVGRIPAKSKKKPLVIWSVCILVSYLFHAPLLVEKKTKETVGIRSISKSRFQSGCNEDNLGRGDDVGEGHVQIANGVMGGARMKRET